MAFALIGRWPYGCHEVTPTDTKDSQCALWGVGTERLGFERVAEVEVAAAWLAGQTDYGVGKNICLRRDFIPFLVKCSATHVPFSSRNFDFASLPFLWSSAATSRK